MLNAIQEFFNRHIEPATRPGEAESGRALQIATAALLLEMMRMDARLTDEERAAIARSLADQFALDDAQVATLMSLAEEEVRAASDYYQFTSLINKSCALPQKVEIVENLWRVAMADGHLDAHELHLMRKLADLLHVGHADYIAAKQRARAAAGLPPA